MTAESMAVIVALLVANSVRAQEEDFAVIHSWMLHTDAENSLYQHFLSQAFDPLDARSREVATFELGS